MDKKTIRMGIIFGSILLLIVNIHLYINDISLISNNSLFAQQLVEITGEDSLHKIISITIGILILIVGLIFWNKNQDEE